MNLGARLAFRASRSRLLGLVIGQGMTPVVVGLLACLLPARRAAIPVTSGFVADSFQNPVAARETRGLSTFEEASSILPGA
jgi:hypothetical protein